VFLYFLISLDQPGFCLSATEKKKRHVNLIFHVKQDVQQTDVQQTDVHIKQDVQQTDVQQTDFHIKQDVQQTRRSANKKTCESHLSY
jgi:hypothetical protein